MTTGRMPQPPATLNSLPEYILGLARLGSRRTALIEQHLYRSLRLSYAELIGKACGMQLELRRRGLQPGDRVMLWGASGAAWAIAFYGCLLAGAVVVPLDAAFSADLAARVREQTEAVLLCSDHEGGLGTAQMRFDEILALPPAPVPAAAAAPPPETLLEIVYTSGATADPKGVMITHGNVLANLRPVANEVRKYKRKMRLVLPLGFLHLIPLSHLFGQIMGLLIPPLVDSYVIYPESQAPAQWAAMLKRYRASALVAVPQQLTLFSQWAEGEIGMRLEQARAVTRGHGMLARFWRWRKLHRKLGWKMWAFIVGGAALSPLLEEGWNALGYAVVQGYGLTETAPAIAITHPFKIRRGAVGQTLEGVEVKIAPDGEILVRGPSVFSGYYHLPEATAEALDGGWFHTGDVGRLDADGYLYITDRKRDLIKTSGGKFIAPQPIENRLKASGLVAEAVVVGEGRKYAVALLTPHWPALEAQGLDCRDRAAACADARVQALFAAEVERVNAGLARFETLKKFALLQAEFTVASGELTPTVKVRRRAVEANCRELIDSLYD